MKFKELDTIKMLNANLEKGISEGDIGTIVYIFNYPNEAYEIEFINDDGSTKAMIVALSSDIELVNI